MNINYGSVSKISFGELDYGSVFEINEINGQKRIYIKSHGLRDDDGELTFNAFSFDRSAFTLVGDDEKVIYYPNAELYLNTPERE